MKSKTNLHIETHKNVGGKRKSSFYNFVIKRLSNSYKQASKRASFTMQKGVFYTSKGHVLHCKDALLECKRYSIQTLTVILFYKHKSYPDGR